MIKFNISSIETFGLLDGPGIRVVLFLQGCNLRCKFCHNPETWSTKENNIYELEQLVKFILKYKDYFKNNGGVTLSGGEPLLQTNNLILLCQKLKENNINIALDTAGIGVGNIEKLLNYIDLILFSIKGLDDLEYKEIAKASKEKSDDFLTLCIKKQKKIWLRHVIIPNYNDTFEYIDLFYNYIKDIPNVDKIELLPYHNMANKKYIELNLENKMVNTNNMSITKCKDLEVYLNEKIVKN